MIELIEIRQQVNDLENYMRLMNEVEPIIQDYDQGATNNS